MVLDREGNEYTVDWYFQDVNPQLFGHTHFGSLNWSKPDYGAGLVGEVIGAPRPWRNGSVPPLICNRFLHTVRGTDDDFIRGAATPLVVPRPIIWSGKDRLNCLGVKGLFPPYSDAAPSLTLTSSVRGVADVQAHDLYYSWTWSAPPGFGIAWGPFLEPPPNLIGCVPNRYPMYAYNNAGRIDVMRCIEAHFDTGVSKWVDDAPGLLAPGETMTLNGYPGPLL